MKPEVKAAVVDWGAGLLIGSIPLFAHGCAFWTIAPAAENHVVGGWAIDILFIGMTLASTSIFSVVNQARRPGAEILNGRAIPALALLNAVFIVLASVHYAGLVSGHSRPNAVYSAIGTALGAGSLSLYLELTLAARVLYSAPVRKRARNAPA